MTRSSVTSTTAAASPAGDQAERRHTRRCIEREEDESRGQDTQRAVRSVVRHPPERSLSPMRHVEWAGEQCHHERPEDGSIVSEHDNAGNEHCGLGGDGKLAREEREPVDRHTDRCRQEGKRDDVRQGLTEHDRRRPGEGNERQQVQAVPAHTRLRPHDDVRRDGLPALDLHGPPPTTPAPHEGDDHDSAVSHGGLRRPHAGAAAAVHQSLGAYCHAGASRGGADACEIERRDTCDLQSVTRRGRAVPRRPAPRRDPPRGPPAVFRRCRRVRRRDRGVLGLLGAAGRAP